MRCCYPPIYADEGDTSAQDTVATQDYDKVDDPNTFDAWYDTQAYNTATTGRIWADKTVDTDPIVFDKGNALKDQSIAMSKDADFQVALSALSSTSNTSGYTAVPLDIALVLDVSGSMEEDFGTGSQTKLDSLKAAVNNFLDEAAEVNKGISDDDKKINVSLVKFAGDKNDSIGDDTYKEYPLLGFPKTYNCSQIVKSLTTCAGANVGTLKEAVNKLTARGATRADYGLEYAQKALNGSGNRKDANKIVIFFTDGSPTSSNGYEDDVAHNAIQKAQQLKTGKVQIYTIGIFDDANSAEPDKNSSAEDTFMHAVSSNYPKAECVDTTEREPGLFGREYTKHTVTLHAPASNSAFYKTASNAGTLTNVFTDIFTEISSGLMGPTHVEGTDPSASGYVTFNDPLGDFMEVKSIDGVAFADTIYKATECGAWKKDFPAKGTDTFEFYDKDISSGVSEAYPQHANLKKIIITIERGTGAQGDYVTVKIPASMLPLRKYTVATDKQGETKLTVSDTFPINILYSVGLREDVRTALENGTSTDAALVEYVKNNAKDGKISFYSNKYSGKTLNNVTVGDTTATFVPASSNSFYYHTVEAPLYKDKACTTPVTEFKTGTQYFYKLTYYEVKNGTTTQATTAVPMTITDESAVGDCIGYYDKNGQAYIKKGTLKGSMPAALDSQLGAKKDPVTKQDVNPTGTAERRIDFQWDLSSSTAHLYLGNNGRITYKAKGSLKIKKVVNAAAGLTPDKNDTFKIKVDLTGADGSYKYTINDEDSGKTIKSGDTLELKANDVAEIVGLPVGCTYTVTEPTVPAGYANVSIVDSGTGKITAGLVNTTAPTVTVTNTYTPTAYVKAFTGSKNFVGRDEWSPTDKFDFILTAINNAPMPADVINGNTKTVTVRNKNEAAEFSFGEITFTQPGTYKYTIREDKGSIPGVSYDGSTYTVTVVVRADKGKLDGTVTYEKTGSAATNAPTNAPAPDKAEFTNTYKADDEVVTPVAFKNYVDDSGSTSLQDKQFQFTLVPANVNENNDPLAEDLVNSTPKPSIPTATNNVNGRITFGTIKFDSSNKDHEYYYLMSEVPSSDNDNIVYSQETYLVKYKVDNNTASAELEATPTYYKLVNDTWTQVTESEVIFTNTYKAKSVDDVTLGVRKQLDGRAWQNGDDFTFTLTPTGDTPALDTNTTYTARVTPTTHSAFFPPITYTKIGTYTYTITEDPVQIPGVTAGDPVTVTVTVTNNNGKLEAAVNYSAEYKDEASDEVYANYINTYSTIAATPKTSDLFHIHKELKGRNWTPNDSFEFRLEGDSGSPMPEQAYRNAYATNTNDSPSIGGDSTLPFTAAGEYTYYISEVLGNQDNGLTYDTTRYKVVVKVGGKTTDENKVKLEVEGTTYYKGTLNADGDYDYSNEPEGTPVATFENHYDASIPAGTTFTLTGYKSLLNRPAKNGEFHFTLTDITNGPDHPGQILHADNKDGTFTFNVDLSPVQTTYTELLAQAAQPADNSEQPSSAPAEIQPLLERRYILAETVPTADTKGVTYDTTTYLVVVPLKDDGNGKLYVDNDNIKYYRNGDKDTGETPNLSFANSYTAESVTLRITARKELTGRALQAGEFTFVLKDAQGIELQRVQNEANGSIHFDLQYDDKQDDTALESDSYTYTISEVAGSDDTIAYDATTYTFTVKVTDKGDGKLVAELDQPKDMVFRNSYTPKPTPTPTPTPSAAPTAAPTAEPSTAPTPAPTTAPAAAPQATPAPTDAPTATPTASPAPTATAPAATATPASVIPRTADSFPLALLIGLAIVSCGALGILYTAKKRRK